MSKEYYKTKESVEEYIQLAKDVNGKELISQLKKVLPANSNLLELGSGPGTDWDILSQDFNTTGSDFSEEFLHHLRKRFPNGIFLELNAITLDINNTFDGIYSNKVLHHLSDEQLAKSVHRQSEILNKGGIICHSFWKGEGSEVFKAMFVNYHSEESLNKFFSQCFEILSISVYQEFDKDDSLLLIARKK